jgi:iron complex transport system substrate-binding protein
MKKIAFCTLMAIMLMFIGGQFQSPPLYAAEYKTVTDMCDNKVDVPVDLKRIACMHCVSPEKIMTLGKGNLIRLMAAQSPWAYRLFPEIKNAESNKGVTPKQMLDMKIDIVLYTPGMTKGETFSTAGLTTVCAFAADKRPMNVDEFMENFERQISLFGDLLGPHAKAIADKYNQYFDGKVKEILSLTAKIDPKDRPAVYYGGLHASMLGSQGKGSVMHWITEISGGNYLPRALGDNHAKATLQQVWSWKPDIILLSGYCDSTDMVTKNRDWASMDAVKKGKVYLIPMGIYTWDHASGEGVLLMIHLAKIFHPDLFRDWDMIKEMKTFYSEVYGKTVTDADVDRILKHLPPAS